MFSIRRFRTLSLRRISEYAVVASCFLMLTAPMSAQAANPVSPRSPEEIIYELAELMRNSKVKDQQYCDQENRLSRELSALGDKAIPAIKSAIPRARVYVQSALSLSLGEINTPLATDTLLEFALQDSDKNMSEFAIARLSIMTMHRPLSQDEFFKLLSKLKAEEEPQALGVAEILSKCGRNDVVQRAKAIMGRFIWQLNHPPKVKILEAYVSTEVWYCNQYILCLQKLDHARVRKLLKDELAKAKDKRVATWLTIASGMLGEESLGAELCRIVDSESDFSVRAWALRGYATAAKRKAIPFLRRYIDFRLPDADPKNNYSNPLQIVARDELSRLGERLP